MSKFDWFDGNAANGGVDAAFASDSTTGEIVAIFFSRIFVEREGDVEACFEGVIEVFPPAVVARRHGSSRDAADLMTISVFDLDFHNADVSINALKSKTGVIAVGIGVEQSRELARDTLGSSDCGRTMSKTGDTANCSSTHGSEWVVVPVVVMTRAVVDILAEDAGGATTTDSRDLSNTLEVFNGVGGNAVGDIPVLATPAGADVGKCTFNWSWLWTWGGGCS